MEHDRSIEILPLVPLKESIVFPDSMAPLAMGRPRSVAALQAAVTEYDNCILMVAQKDPGTEEPGWNDLHRVATQAIVTKVEGAEEGVISVTVVGQERVELLEAVEGEHYLKAKYRLLPLPVETGVEI